MNATELKDKVKYIDTEFVYSATEETKEFYEDRFKTAIDGFVETFGDSDDLIPLFRM